MFHPSTSNRVAHLHIWFRAWQRAVGERCPAFTRMVWTVCSSCCAAPQRRIAIEKLLLEASSPLRSEIARDKQENGETPSALYCSALQSAPSLILRTSCFVLSLLTGEEPSFQPELRMTSVFPGSGVQIPVSSSPLGQNFRAGSQTDENRVLKSAVGCQSTNDPTFTMVEHLQTL